MSAYPPELMQALDFSFGQEGKFSNDKNDPGGPTAWGISTPVARGYGYIGKMELLPKDLAVEIYYMQYWLPLMLYRIPDFMLQKRMLDMAINCGVTRTISKIQQLLNRLNDQGKRWPDIVEDGHLGGATLGCLTTVLGNPKFRAQFLFDFDCLRGAYYLEDLDYRRQKGSEGSDANEYSVFGWMNRTALLIRESVELLVKTWNLAA